MSKAKMLLPKPGWHVAKEGISIVDEKGNIVGLPSLRCQFFVDTPASRERLVEAIKKDAITIGRKIRKLSIVKVRVHIEIIP